jgi:ribosomal protein L31E
MLSITDYQRNANQSHNEVHSFMANHTAVRMAMVKKSVNNKYWRGCGEKGALLHC